MASKKVYAVRKGKNTGIFYSWEQCKEAVSGYSGAEYRGFPSREEAEEYLNMQKPGMPLIDSLSVYVDGSFESSIAKYAFGCVFLMKDGRVFVRFGNGNNEESVKLRNVTGEMLGAMYAVRTAIFNGYHSVQIYYDYEGIEKWVTGVWRARTELTQKYAESMQKWQQQVEIRFIKVMAHSNVEWNELADRMAKRGLEEADGIPSVCKIEEMMEWKR